MLRLGGGLQFLVGEPAKIDEDDSPARASPFLGFGVSGGGEGGWRRNASGGGGRLFPDGGFGEALEDGFAAEAAFGSSPKVLGGVTGFAVHANAKGVRADR